MSKGKFGVGAVGLVAMSFGCATIVGIDKEYELAGGAAAGGGVSGSEPAPQLRSCAALTTSCGPEGNEDCCTSPLVPGGTYNRSNDPGYPAKVSDFRLDKFEVTVGRFRAFVNAYPKSKPVAGAGAHPKITGSGWGADWDLDLPADQEALIKKISECVFDDVPIPTWTPTPGPNENLPMNCISWYEAFAFCLWDGGRLPTEAEWNYAAAGGAEQRGYPWGSEPEDPARAVSYCTGDGSAPASCSRADILPVGSRPLGNARWGHADMAGSLWEFTLDWYHHSMDPMLPNYTYPRPCIDCADLNKYMANSHGGRGGSWHHAFENLTTVFRGDIPVYKEEALTVTYRDDRDGVRCARNP